MTTSLKFTTSYLVRSFVQEKTYYDGTKTEETIPPRKVTMHCIRGTSSKKNGRDFGNKKKPHKVKIFLWYAMHNALPSLHLLKSRGIYIDESCKWCRKDTETTSHILWSCPLAKSCWQFFSSWFELTSPIPHNIDKILNIFSGKDHVAGSNFCIAATIWTICLTRNECIFKDSKPDKNSLHIIIRARA